MKQNILSHIRILIGMMLMCGTTAHAQGLFQWAQAADVICIARVNSIEDGDGRHASV